ncbi:MAG: ImmA/IrrE family metallo-endopeptidase [Anaerovoracaceae bacterium]
MTKRKELVAEYDNELLIEERPIKNHGLYADNVVWINKNLNTASKYCILAEEVGHYQTSHGDILDQTSLDNQKQELKARRWAYEKILPIGLIRFALNDGHTEIWDMAEYLDVNENFLREALKYYGLLT